MAALAAAGRGDLGAHALDRLVEARRARGLLVEDQDHVAQEGAVGGDELFEQLQRIGIHRGVDVEDERRVRCRDLDQEVEDRVPRRLGPHRVAGHGRELARDGPEDLGGRAALDEVGDELGDERVEQAERRRGVDAAQQEGAGAAREEAHAQGVEGPVHLAGARDADHREQRPAVGAGLVVVLKQALDGALL
ncbi:MAG: hypothetical protein QM765_33450 [Myxococcales bacterium]